MKKQITIILLALLPTFIYSQDIFEKYEDNSDVTFVAMQPKMFQMLAKISVDTDDPEAQEFFDMVKSITCLLYTSPSPRDKRQSRMPSSA